MIDLLRLKALYPVCLCLLDDDDDPGLDAFSQTLIIFTLINFENMILIPSEYIE